MLLLPVAGALGVLVVPKIILVLRLGQPSPHELAFPGLAAVGLEAIALALSTPVIGKKKFLAVQALASGLGRLHRFQIKRNQYRKAGAKNGRKSSRKKSQTGEEGRKIFSESVEENPLEEDPILNRQVCIHSISPVAVPCTRGIVPFGAARGKPFFTIFRGDGNGRGLPSSRRWSGSSNARWSPASHDRASLGRGADWRCF